MAVNTVLNDKINTAANIDIVAINLVVPIFVDSQKTTKILYKNPHKNENLTINLNLCVLINT